MTTYRKKPVTVEARELTVDNATELAKWCNGTATDAYSRVLIPTLEGTMLADLGDYIIKGVKGEFYPCKHDIFEATYTEVGATGDRGTLIARLIEMGGTMENSQGDTWVHAPAEIVEQQAQLVLGETVATDPTSTVSRAQQQVRTFQERMGLPVGTTSRALPADRVAVRVELIREEFQDELIPALEAGDMVETADAAIDIMYVTLGLLVEMGINAEVLFDEVQRSNLSKFDADGNPIIAGPNDPDGVFEGRVKKGPNYFRPALDVLLKSGQADLG